MRAIDCWLNVNMGELGRPDYLVEVAKNYFKQGEDFFRNYSIDETVALMDELGVEKAILTTDPIQPSEHTLSFAKAQKGNTTAFAPFTRVYVNDGVAETRGE